MCFLTPGTWSPGRASFHIPAYTLGQQPTEHSVHNSAALTSKKNEEGTFNVTVSWATCKALYPCGSRWETRRLRRRGSRGPPHGCVAREGELNGTCDQAAWCLGVCSGVQAGFPRERWATSGSLHTLAKVLWVPRCSVSPSKKSTS